MSCDAGIETLLKNVAHANGFASFGIAPAVALPSVYENRFRNWLKDEKHGPLHYLTRNIEKRFNASLLVPGARSVIMLAKGYGNGEMARKNQTGIALYAWGEDYHHHLRKSAQPLIHLLNKHHPDSESVFFTDTAPISERSYAALAGLGSIGKNGTLITKDHGSMVWLSALVTTVPLSHDEPVHHDPCGSCKKCIVACPTNAITTSGMIDVTRCIAFHTNSSKLPIPDEITVKLNGQLFGCDVCQQVCPWNDPAANTDKRTMHHGYPESWPGAPADWLDKDEAWFNERFTGTALEHTGWDRLHYQANLLSQLNDSVSAHPDEGK